MILMATFMDSSKPAGFDLLQVSCFVSSFRMLKSIACLHTYASAHKMMLSRSVPDGLFVRASVQEIMRAIFSCLDLCGLYYVLNNFGKGSTKSERLMTSAIGECFPLPSIPHPFGF
jgi:hypothetical protein